MSLSEVPFPFTGLVYPPLTETEQEAMFIAVRAKSVAAFSHRPIRLGGATFSHYFTDNLYIEVRESDREIDIQIEHRESRVLLFKERLHDKVWSSRFRIFVRGEWEQEFADQTADAADPQSVAEFWNAILLYEAYEGRRPCRQIPAR